jgi:hypothetical protein
MIATLPVVQLFFFHILLIKKVRSSAFQLKNISLYHISHLATITSLVLNIMVFAGDAGTQHI